MAVKVKLNLNFAGREYLHFPVSGLPPTPLGEPQINFPGLTPLWGGLPPTWTGGWFPMDWVVQADGVWSLWDTVTGLPTHARVLVGGPDPDLPVVPLCVTLPVGTASFELRLVSDVEVIIRTSPTVIVVSPS